MRILIVEDERAIAEVEKAYIERDGYSAEIAADGLEGIGKFREKQFDLVILDLMLPGMSGIDVCREIRRSSSAPIIRRGRRLYSEAFFAAHTDGAHQGEPAQERDRGGFRVGAYPRW